MTRVFSDDSGPLVLLHGGAGPMDPGHAAGAAAVASLTRVALVAHERLVRGDDGLDVATFCCEELEDDPMFNAGTGSALQADGMARVSAASMHGALQRFSGVVAASYVTHPSRMSRVLQQRRDRVLTAPGTELLARELGLPAASNLTANRVQRWVGRQSQHGFRALENLARSGVDGDTSDTVGCVIRTANGDLFAAASTGGRGFEFPGRVSDTCTVAGTYASAFAAVAATGIGEQIVDDALASRLETRVRDGMSLSDASARCLDEASRGERAYGWIAVSTTEWCIAHTTRSMPFVVAGSSTRGPAVLCSSASQLSR